MNTTLNIGLAGLGTVGGGLVRLLSENAEEIRARSGCDFNLKAVAVRNPNRKRDLPEGVRLTTDPMTLADDPDIDVVIELMGGIDTAKELITRSLAKGKQVVTANKALLAEEGESLFRLADEKGATLLYEASVAGGIPIVQTLKESLTGNHITSLEGILNGTGNYILSEMTSKGVNFAPALAEAQEKGYAEADPTLDIDGFDTAHKLVLLIRLAWGVDYPYTKMPIEGIRNLDKMDIDFAREFGYRIKLLGRARMRDGKLEAGVFPTLVNHTYLLARVGGAYNAVRVEGNAVGSLFLHGLGAGSLPTASAVLGDLISIARQNNKLNSGFVKQVLPQADILGFKPSIKRLVIRGINSITAPILIPSPKMPGILSNTSFQLAQPNAPIPQPITIPKNSGSPINPNFFFIPSESIFSLSNPGILSNSLLITIANGTKLWQNG